MRRFLFSLLMLLPGATLHAATSPQSFAYQASLDPASQALQRVAIPVEILLQLAHRSFVDIAVFNADGKMLPLAVVKTPSVTRELVTNLPYHEFSQFQRDHLRTIKRRRQSQQDGSLSELQTVETVPVQTRSNAFLVELGRDDDGPDFDRVELEWRHEPASQLLELRVESGNELDRLRVIKSRKSLSNLAGQDLSWRSIGGIPRGDKYLRLTPTNGVENFELRAVRGHYRELDPPPTLTHRLTPETIEQDGQVYYAFDLPGRIGPESIRIVPAAEHSVVSGDLYASWGGKDDKHLIRRDFRQHNIDGEDVKQSDPIRLSRRQLERIWFTSDAELATTPRVELIFPQSEVLFLGDGNAPYRIAWGNYELESRQSSDLRGLLDLSIETSLERAESVKLGPRETAGGLDRLAAKAALPWQKWLLWSLLIGAAVVTGRMAWRLYQEMNTAETTAEG